MHMLSLLLQLRIQLQFCVNTLSPRHIRQRLSILGDNSSRYGKRLILPFQHREILYYNERVKYSRLFIMLCHAVSAFQSYTTHRNVKLYINCGRNLFKVCGEIASSIRTYASSSRKDLFHNNYLHNKAFPVEELLARESSWNISLVLLQLSNSNIFQTS